LEVFSHLEVEEEAKFAGVSDNLLPDKNGDASLAKGAEYSSSLRPAPKRLCPMSHRRIGRPTISAKLKADTRV
jgi:hypothetical protein